MIDNQSPSPPTTELEEMIERRERILSLIEQGTRALGEANALAPGGLLASTYREFLWYSNSVEYLVGDALKRAKYYVDRHGWSELIDKTRLSVVMNAEQKNKFKKQLAESPPPITRETVIPTFVGLFENRYKTFREGIVDLFKSLYSIYKSNDPFKIGKRIILHRALGEMYWERDKQDRFNDLERILLILDGRDPASVDVEDTSSQVILEARRNGEEIVETQYFNVRLFANGNIHVWLRDQKFIDKINHLIAEHYGECLSNRS